ncbi:hypothetical protein AB0F77_09825 [Streptomyces sp. NPDC026672]|uniref:hypothetical protein n=1 Tax=unclassified Streptomyces TaxID=2593676 RepID=UPI0033E24937
MYTTPAPAVDIAQIVPELFVWRRTTVRLHPRPGDPHHRDSHVGGPMLRVAGSGRPVCEEHPMDPDGRLPRPMVSVAQFFRDDLPEIPYPAGCDLLQVYWCPNEHYIEYADSDFAGPAVELVWLDSAKGGREPLEDRFRGVRPLNGSYEVRPCRISPERVVEFPDAGELPGDLARRLLAVDRERGLHYRGGLSVARGWKVGGWPDWHAADVRDLYCPDCSESVDLLLKVDSSEWDGDGDRWWPAEDRTLDPGPLATAHEPTGTDVGRHGELRVFTCRDDVRHRPVLDIR